MKEKNNDEMLTVNEVCEWLKITRKTTERWRKQGMPFKKMGSTIRFKKNEVEEWINQQNK